jgi:hypothetical protein
MGLQMPGAPSFSRTLRKGWAMGIVGALYGSGAAAVSERSQAVGAESHPSKNEGWGTRPCAQNRAARGLVETLAGL